MRIEGCRVHGVGRPSALDVAYADNVTLQRNIIYDLYYNCRGVGLSLGRRVTNLTVRRNTITGADRCVRAGGLRA